MGEADAGWDLALALTELDNPKLSTGFAPVSIKTIARRFLSARPPDLGERMADAKDLSMVLRSTAWGRMGGGQVPL